MKITINSAIESGIIIKNKGTGDKKPDSVEMVRKIREDTCSRYEEEIGDALDKLLKKPKSEWPKLFRK